MKMLKSNIFKLVLMVIAVLAFPFSVSAEENEHIEMDEEVSFSELSLTEQNEMIEIIENSSTEKTVSEIQQYALSFMQNSQPDHDIKVMSTYPLYGMDDNITGYYITFYRDDVPNGFVLISFLHTGTPIVTCSFEGLGIIENVENSWRYLYTDDLKYLGPDELYLENDSTGVYTSITDDTALQESDVESIYQNSLAALHTNVETVQMMNDTSSGTIYDGVINWDAVILDQSTIYKLPEFGVGSSYWIMNDFLATNHCSPTACTNVLWYWGWQFNPYSNNNVRLRINAEGSLFSQASQVFWKVYDGAGTTDSGTPVVNIPNAFEYYFGTPAGTGVWAYRRVDGFTSVYNTIIENCPICMNFFKGTGLGHSVFALGRAQDTSDNNYVIVLDGWVRSGRLVIDNYYNNVSGYKIFVAN